MYKQDVKFTRNTDGSLTFIYPAGTLLTDGRNIFILLGELTLVDLRHLPRHYYWGPSQSWSGSFLGLSETGELIEDVTELGLLTEVYYGDEATQ